jgi:hypothetical protein
MKDHDLKQKVINEIYSVGKDMSDDEIKYIEMFLSNLEDSFLKLDSLQKTVINDPKKFKAFKKKLIEKIGD